MKILGKIHVSGTDVYQVSSFDPEVDHIQGARKGSYAFVDALEVYELKTQNGKNSWQPTTFRIMFMNILDWATIMLNSGESFRDKMSEVVFDGLQDFNALEKMQAKKKGNFKAVQELEKVGEGFVQELKSDYHVVGFCPVISYLMRKERGEGSLETFWEHPFSMPTLLLKHKELPILVLANPNLDYDNSRLIKMAHAKEIEVDEVIDGEYVFESKRKILGITG